MLLDGINHVAIITENTDRFVRFYEDVFDATVSSREEIPPGTLTMVDVGPRTELNVFELREGGDAQVRGSMFGHGPKSPPALAAGEQEPGGTAHKTSGAGGEYAKGGSTKMFGFSPSVPATAGITGPR